MTGESTVLGPVLKLFNEQLELDIKSSDINNKAHRFGLSFNNKPRPILGCVSQQSLACCALKSLFKIHWVNDTTNLTTHCETHPW